MYLIKIKYHLSLDPYPISVRFLTKIKTDLDNIYKNKFICDPYYMSNKTLTITR